MQIENQPQESSPGFNTSHKIILAALFVVSIGIRFFHITAPPFEFHPTRQFYSALLTRSMYEEEFSRIYPESKDVLPVVKEKIQPREPQVMQRLVGRVYTILKKEPFWVPRLFSMFFWMIGGILLCLFVKEIFGPPGALWSTAAYLFFPFGIHMSRAFMPEALMNAFFIAALWAIYRCGQIPRLSRFLTAVLISSIAIYIKFVVFFPLAGAYILMNVASGGWKKFFRSSRTYLFFISVFLLGFSHYLLTLFSSSALRGTARAVLSPHMIFTAFFWKGWLIQIGRITGILPFILGLLSLFLIQRKSTKYLLAGAYGGYFIYGLLFAYSTATHDYYQISLFTLILISLGQTGDIFTRLFLHDRKKKKWAFPAVVISSGVILFFSLGTADLDLLNNTAKKYLRPAAFIICGSQLVSWDEASIPEIIKTSREIGTAVGHNTNSIFLAREYGFPLIYYGHVYGTFWPGPPDLEAYKRLGRKELRVEERLSLYLAATQPEYFIVEDMAAWNELEDLRIYLLNHYPNKREKKTSIIFDLR